MNTRPRLTRSIPFWLLIAGSVASAAAGAFILLDRLGTMETALTAGTATGVEVYVGQIWAVLGAILIGVGAIGLLLAFTLGALRAFAVTSTAPIEAEQQDEDEDEAVEDPASETSSEPALDGAR